MRKLVSFTFVAAAFIILSGFSSTASAEDLEFLLINQSSDDLVGFYVSHTDTNAWEENLLEGGFLPPGNQISVIIADGLTTCMYDILGEFANGDEATDENLNLCDLGEYTFTD